MATIVTNTKNIRHKDKTLDKVLDSIKDGTIIASKTQLGNIKVGDTLDIFADGKLDVGKASPNKLGGVKPSWTITDESRYTASIGIKSNGTIEVLKAEQSSYGVIRANVITGSSISNYAEQIIDRDGRATGHEGYLVIKKATNNDYGVVKLGPGLYLDDNGCISSCYDFNVNGNDINDAIQAFHNIQNLGNILENLIPNGIKMRLVQTSGDNYKYFYDIIVSEYSVVDEADTMKLSIIDYDGNILDLYVL